MSIQAEGKRKDRDKNEKQIDRSIVVTLERGLTGVI